MTSTKVDFDSIDIAALTDVPLLTTAGYISLMETLVSVTPSAPSAEVTRALERLLAGLAEAKRALVERLGNEVDTALERSFDNLVDSLWIYMRGQLEFWQPVVEPIVAPRAGIFVEGEEPNRSCTRRTARFGDNALGEKTKRGGARGFTTGC